MDDNLKVEGHSITVVDCSEYCAPVIATVSTAEVEGICLKNGLLFHELLRSFFEFYCEISDSCASINQRLWAFRWHQYAHQICKSTNSRVRWTSTV